MDLLQELIRAVRDARSRHGVPPGKKVELLVVADGTERQIIQDNREMIYRLAHVGELPVDRRAEKPPRAVSILGGTVQAFIPGIVDEGKELERLEKQEEQLSERIASAQNKLANSNFVSRAKPEVVQRERDNLRTNEGRLGTVREQIEQIRLGSA